MRLRLVALCVAIAASIFACSSAPCCTEPRIQRDISYAGTAPSGARVSVRLNADGTSTITWVKDGHDVVLRYQQQF